MIPRADSNKVPKQKKYNKVMRYFTIIKYSITKCVTRRSINDY